MILVVGSTGLVGGMIARQLLAAGNEVRVLVRPQSDFQPLVQIGAMPLIADLKDRASLDAACEGIHTLITTATSGSRGGEDNPQTVDLEGNRNLVDAAKKAGVKQVVLTSFFGANPDHPSPLIRAKGLSESYLRESGVPYTILAPATLMDLTPMFVIGMPLRSGQPVTLVGEGHRKHSFIAARDVAAFAVAAVGHPAAMGRRLTLGGPEALSWREVLATVERVMGRAIPVRWVAAGEPMPGMPDVLPQVMAALESSESIIDMGETARTFGVHQTTWEKFVRENFTEERAAA